MVNILRKTLSFVLFAFLLSLAACYNPWVTDILQSSGESEVFSLEIILQDAEAGDKVIVTFNDQEYEFETNGIFTIEDIPSGVIVTLTAQPGEDRWASFGGDGSTSVSDSNVHTINVTADSNVTVEFGMVYPLDAPLNVTLSNTGKISFEPGDNNPQDTIYWFSLYRGEISVTDFQSIKFTNDEVVEGLSAGMLKEPGKYIVIVRAFPGGGGFSPSDPVESNHIDVFSVSITVTGSEGNDSVTLGGVSHTDNFNVNVFNGTTVTLTAQPGEGRRATFSGAGTAGQNDDNVRIIEVTANAGVTVTFTDEDSLSQGDFIITGNNVVFDNTSRSVTVDYYNVTADEAGEILGWKYVCTAGGGSWTHPSGPTNAGTYEIRVTTEGGSEFGAAVDILIGTLTIKAAPLTIIGATHTRQWNGNYAADGVTVELNGRISGATDVEPDVVTAVYTSSNAGTKELNITAVTLTGNDAVNYIVTVPETITMTEGGITRAAITAVNVSVAPPVVAENPDTTAGIVNGTNFYPSTVTWIPAPKHNKFQGGIAYTASVTLTADSNHYFAESLAVDGNLTEDSRNPIAGTIILSHKFPATAAATVSGIMVSAQPQLSYTHGDTLNLSALRVTLSFNDGTAAPDELLGSGITASPAHGTPLVRATHGDHRDAGVPTTLITVTHTASGQTANTGPLAIDRANVTVPVPHMHDHTTNSITLRAVTTTPTTAHTGQTVQYAMNTTDAVPASGWQSGLLFENLTAGTGYWFFARVVENVNFNGAISTGERIFTHSEGNIDIKVGYFWENMENSAALPWQGTDGELVDNITINRTAQNSVTLTLDGLNDTGYIVRWIIDSSQVPVSRTGTSVTLSYTDFSSLDAGSHLLYVELERLTDNDTRSHTTWIIVSN